MKNKVFLKIGVFFDVLKGFIISVGLKLLIVILFCTIIHNVLKMTELSSKYSGEYKNLIPIYQSKMLNVYSKGSGDKTIVILPGFGSQSPIMQYKPLIEAFKDEYRVIVIEYFGYGYSMEISEERTNENMASEIKLALDYLGISDKFILMPHSISNMYAMCFSIMYPEKVEAIISIDGLYPAEIKDDYYKIKMDDMKKNVNFTSIVEYTGFARILSYLKPSIFYIDKMKEMTNVYTSEDIKIYRNRIGSSYLTRTMVREINNTKQNMEQLKDFKYRDDLPVLQVLSSDTVKEYSDAKKNGDSKIDLKELSNNVISNYDIQKIVIINGDHMLQLTNINELAKEIRSFLINL